MSASNHTDFKKFLNEHLKNSELATAYLNEVLANGDRKALLLALYDVIESQCLTVYQCTLRADK